MRRLPLPEGIAEFFVHAFVADDGELVRARRKIKQDRIAFPGGGHPKLFESLGGMRETSSSLSDLFDW